MKELKITDQLVIVDYWKEIEKYTISFSLPNTIDGNITCIVENSSFLPETLKKPGTKAVFSGVLIKNSKMPAPRLGGEEIYILSELIDLKAFK